MEEMLNFARQAYLKHKVIEINYNMKEKQKTQEEIDEWVAKYKDNVKHEYTILKPEETPSAPTGTTEQLAIENK